MANEQNEGVTEEESANGDNRVEITENQSEENSITWKDLVSNL